MLLLSFVASSQECRSAVYMYDCGIPDYTHLKVAQWLSGRVLDSRPKGRGFDPPPASLRCGP